MTAPTVEDVAGWFVTVSDALPAHGLESRLALSLLVAELTRLKTEAEQAQKELQRVRVFRLLQGGVR